MKKYVILSAISILLSACAGTKQEPVSQTQAEIVENACDPEKGNCDCQTWPEDNCYIPHSLVMEQLKSGVHPDKILNENGHTMLMQARDIASVKALIAAGADVNGRDEYEDTPLIIAVYRGQIDIVNALIAAGADVNAMDNKGRTPLLISVMWHQLECVKALIAAGADVKVKDMDGVTPLMSAFEHEYGEIIGVLSEAGAKE